MGVFDGCVVHEIEGGARIKNATGIFSLLGDSILLSTNDGVSAVQLDKCAQTQIGHADSREGANGNDNYEQDDIDDDSRGSAYLLQSIFDLGVQTLQKSFKSRVLFMADQGEMSSRGFDGKTFTCKWSVALSTLSVISSIITPCDFRLSTTFLNKMKAANTKG